MNNGRKQAVPVYRAACFLLLCGTKTRKRKKAGHHFDMAAMLF